MLCYHTAHGARQRILRESTPTRRRARRIGHHVLGGMVLAPRSRREGTTMNLRYALLALLADGEAHGYGLRKRFMQRVGPFWQPNIGQIYQVLHELERRGYVTRRDVTSGARLRRLFRLTLRGERALRTWLARRPAWPPPLRDEIIVRVLATERHGTATLLAQLERQEAEYRRYLLVVQAEDPHDAPITRRLAREAALGIAEAYLRWLARCRELLGDARDTKVA
jgi:DNA-binding PadR family transcriptional regulator